MPRRIKCGTRRTTPRRVHGVAKILLKCGGTIKRICASQQLGCHIMLIIAAMQDARDASQRIRPEPHIAIETTNIHSVAPEGPSAMIGPARRVFETRIALPAKRVKIHEVETCVAQQGVDVAEQPLAGVNLRKLRLDMTKQRPREDRRRM